MQFNFNYRLKGSVGRLIASVSLLALLFSVVGTLGSTPASAQSDGTADQGYDNTTASMIQVALRGGVDRASAGKSRVSVAGWACAPSKPFQTLRIDVHNVAISGGAPTASTYLGSLFANKTRESAVARLCGGNPNHGFSGNVKGVCAGRSGAIPVEIRTYAVFSDSPPISTRLPGAVAKTFISC